MPRGETGHVLDQRWRVPSLPIQVGDFVVQTVVADEIGRVAGIFQGPGTNYAGHDEANGKWSPVSIERWKKTCYGNYGSCYLKIPGDAVRALQKHWAWVEGHAWSVG